MSEVEVWNKAIEVVRQSAQEAMETAEWLRNRHGDAYGEGDVKVGLARASVIPFLERARDASLNNAARGR